MGEDSTMVSAGAQWTFLAIAADLPVKPSASRAATVLVTCSIQGLKQHILVKTSDCGQTSSSVAMTQRLQIQTNDTDSQSLHRMGDRFPRRRKVQKHRVDAITDVSETFFAYIAMP
jgi:hypothetical protein